MKFRIVFGVALSLFAYMEDFEVLISFHGGRTRLEGSSKYSGLSAPVICAALSLFLKFGITRLNSVGEE